MKKVAIFKIVAFSILAVFLTTILVLSLTGVNFFNLSFGVGNSFRYANASKYSIASDTVELDSLEIDEIELNWMGGSISFIENAEDKLAFYEEYDASVVTDEDYLMRYLVSGKKLTIQFCKPMWNIKKKIREGKNVFVKLPSKIYSKVEVSSISGDVTLSLKEEKQISALKVDTVSGDINVKNVYLQDLKIDTVSGEVKTSNLNVDSQIDINTVSGDITLDKTTTNQLSIDGVSSNFIMNGSFTNMDINTVSGDITLSLDKAPSRIDCDSVSGDVYLTIPENDGFRAELDSVSGNLQCAFANVYKKEVVYKSGIAIYEFDSTSGDVTIERSN